MGFVANAVINSYIVEDRSSIFLCTDQSFAQHIPLHNSFALSSIPLVLLLLHENELICRERERQSETKKWGK